MSAHDAIEARLSDYVDGELSDAEQRQVAAHLADCPACRATVADLEAVVARARSLPAAEPAADLWSGIAARLEPRAPQAAEVRRSVSLSLPQLLAASVLLAAASGWLATRLVAPPPAVPVTVERADGGAPADLAPAPPDRVVPASLDSAEYDEAVADLKLALDKGRGSLDPATVLILEENLHTISRAVSEARQALADDPANGYLSGYLVDTQRRQLDLLRQTAALVNLAD